MYQIYTCTFETIITGTTLQQEEISFRISKHQYNTIHHSIKS